MSLDLIEPLSIDSWNPVLDTAAQSAAIDTAAQDAAIDALEAGKVLYLPRLRFDVQAAERRFLSTQWSDGKSKNIYLRGRERVLRGTVGSAEDQAALAAMIERFGSNAQSLVSALFPCYVPHLQFGNTSFRPFEIEGRPPKSFRKDDTRLHSDAFPSNPTAGARLLRVFTNVNAQGRPRVWRVGEPFGDMAARILPRARRQWPGEAALLHALHVTKKRRSQFDHFMLELHDRTKADLDYQRDMPQQRVEFPPGSTWIVFSDQVLHAVLSGAMMMEQTWMLPVAALRHPERAPLRVLESMVGRALI
ncbi:MAG: Kdo hydroxylase family protein [Burkholderiales bacterium]|nr:Kdo hydroxylase family protein [Burkholderiales bacterium]